MKKSSLSSNDFSIEVESLRGIAAALVVLGHMYLLSFYVSVHASNLAAFPKLLLEAFFNPQPAVLLFFTISGLVLGRQLRKNPVDNFPSFTAYLFRRGFRLLPLMWFSIFFAFILYSFCAPKPFSILLSTLVLKDISINLALWSIQVELWCSLVFPILFWLFRSSGFWMNFLLFAGLVLISYFVREPLFLQFLVFFHAGLIVDLINEKFNHIQFKNPLILVFAYLIFCLAPEFSMGLRSWMIGHWESWVLPEILACPLILLFIVHNKNKIISSFLRLAWVRHLGKISFSIYLMHFPLLLIMFMLYPATNPLKLVIFYVSFLSLMLIISQLSYHYIEVPFNKLGRKVHRYLLVNLSSKTLLEENNDRAFET